MLSVPERVLINNLFKYTELDYDEIEQRLTTAVEQEIEIHWTTINYAMSKAKSDSLSSFPFSKDFLSCANEYQKSGTLEKRDYALFRILKAFENIAETITSPDCKYISADDSKTIKKFRENYLRDKKN